MFRCLRWAGKGEGKGAAGFVRNWIATTLVLEILNEDEESFGVRSVSVSFSHGPSPLCMSDVSQPEPRSGRRGSIAVMQRWFFMKHTKKRCVFFRFFSQSSISFLSVVLVPWRTSKACPLIRPVLDDPEYVGA